MRNFNYSAIPLKRRVYVISQQMALPAAVAMMIALMIISSLVELPAPGLVILVPSVGIFLLLSGFRGNFLVDFAHKNKLKIIDYPNIKYTEVPFMNKIYNKATLSSAVVLEDSEQYIELFSYTKSANQFLHPIGAFLVMHIKLNSNLPNVVIDASQNDKWLHTDIPVGYQNFTEEYVLEGDFPEFFKVFARDQASVETLQLLGPDLMVKLIDHLQNFNIEFINHSVFITCRSKLITQASFRQLIESSLDIAYVLQKKSRKMRNIHDLYHDRITKN